MYKSEARNLKATKAVCPSDEKIDIGGRKRKTGNGNLYYVYIVDIYRYLKIELWKNWELRTVLLKNYKDKLFCYASESLYRPKEHHFAHFAKIPNLSFDKVARDLR